MFGTNEQAKKVSDQPGDTLQVKEIFYSLQGEGPSAGTPAIFIRLAGCNLKCHFCDTDFDTGVEEMTRAQIYAAMARVTPINQQPLVVITGGEPLRQNIAPLLNDLFDDDFRVEIETAGTITPAVSMARMRMETLTGRLRIICSPKTARVSALVRELCADYKYLVTEGDGTFENGVPSMDSQNVGESRPLFYPPKINDALGRPVTIWIQPMEVYQKEVWGWWKAPRDRYSRDEVRTLANVDYAVKIAQRHGYRVSLQLHKLLGLR